MAASSLNKAPALCWPQVRWGLQLCSCYLYVIHTDLLHNRRSLKGLGLSISRVSLYILLNIMFFTDGKISVKLIYLYFPPSSHLVYFILEGTTVENKDKLISLYNSISLHALSIRGREIDDEPIVSGVNYLGTKLLLGRE